MRAVSLNGSRAVPVGRHFFAAPTGLVIAILGIRVVMQEGDYQQKIYRNSC